jgi:hypothetical protein
MDSGGPPALSEKAVLLSRFFYGSYFLTLLFGLREAFLEQQIKYLLLKVALD